jgi:hypothetical protein
MKAAAMRRFMWEESAAGRILLPCAVMFGFGLLAVVLGQGNSWDLHNYHLYNGWAFWTGRETMDFAAAQTQTYFNPLLDTVAYLLFFNTPPWLSTFALGVVQGANFVPVHALARRLLPAPETGSSRWLPLSVALVGTCGATQLSELGGSIGDNLVSLPVLCAFALVVQASELSLARVATAGLLVGATTGLKLVVAPFAVGLLVAVALLCWRQHGRWKLILAAGAAIGIGFFATDAFWMLHLYREFGNPLHPLFGEIFGGPYAPPMQTRDTRFVPQTLIEWLFYPLVWVATPHRASDSFFFDLRIALAYLTIPLLFWRCAGIDRRLERALLLVLLVSYVVWLAQFGIYRYAAPLEMLAPLVMVLALSRLPAHNAGMAAAVLLPLMVVAVRPPGWGHLHGYGGKYLETTLPAFPRLAEATILFAEDEPLSFLALGFPPSANFVRIGGNLLGWPYPYYAADREAARRIAAANGPLYAVVHNAGSERVRENYARQHLVATAPCAPIASNLLAGNSSAQLCPVQLQATP